jgi:hypothetical protein
LIDESKSVRHVASVKEAFDVNQTIHGTVPGIPAAAGQMTGGQARLPGVPEMPGLRLMIGVDGDLREWVQVANALLDCIASGAVRAGSRVPPVASLGLATAVPPGAAGRAFRVLASEGVLHWVPRLGYHVRTSITVVVSSRPRRDGGLTAVLPGGVRRQQAGHGVPVSSGAGRR